MRKKTFPGYRFLLVGLACVASMHLTVLRISQHAGGEELSKPSTSRTAKQSAIKAIPLDQLNQEARKKVLSVINNTSVYRRLPASRYVCDPDMHNFLIRYPEVIVGIWKVMGITQVDAKRVGQYEISATDGMGTSSNVELLYGTRNLHVFYGQGFYQGPLFHNKLRGSCILVLRSEFGHNRNGDPIVQDRLDVFLRVDNIGVKILARTLHSLVGKTADINFTESTKFIGKVSDTAEVNGSGVQRLGNRIENLEPEVREAFGKLAILVNDRAAGRLQEQLKVDTHPTNRAKIKTYQPQSLPPIRPASGPIVRARN